MNGDLVAPGGELGVLRGGDVYKRLGDTGSGYTFSRRREEHEGNRAILRLRLPHESSAMRTCSVTTTDSW
jgi:hypothetical protein